MVSIMYQAAGRAKHTRHGYRHPSRLIRPSVHTTGTADRTLPCREMHHALNKSSLVEQLSYYSFFIQ